MDYLPAILSSPAVWSACIVVLRLVADYAAIPADITNAIMLLVIAILAAVGVGDVRAEAKRLRSIRARQP